MKKIALLAVLVGALSVAGFAQEKKEEGTKKDAPMVCAVMKEDKVDVAKATKDKLFSDYKGRRYFFCCGGCKPKFDKDPETFSKTAPSIEIPGKKKKKG